MILLITVYVADTSSLKEGRLYQKLYARLDKARQTKADGFRFARDKRLSVGAGALLLYALHTHNVRETSIVLDANGKPYLAENGNVFFNLSHSGQMVMCAVSDREVGCDVEEKAAFDPALAAYVMTKEELRYIDAAHEEARQDIFYRLWTLKESYMKATGLGLQLHPASFGMTMTNGVLQVHPALDQRSFSFKEYFVGDGYCYSCCALSMDFSPTMTEMDFREI